MKVRKPEEIVMEETQADEEILADATICCLDCDRNQSDWDRYQRDATARNVDSTNSIQSPKLILSSPAPPSERESVGPVGVGP
jgi:hypothetical protein